METIEGMETIEIEEAPGMAAQRKSGGAGRRRRARALLWRMVAGGALLGLGALAGLGGCTPRTDVAGLGPNDPERILAEEGARLPTSEGARRREAARARGFPDLHDVPARPARAPAPAAIGPDAADATTAPPMNPETREP